MAGVAKEPGQRQSNSHIVALLSLKILLLAFFILLNAMATFEEERSTAVFDSVRQTFQGILPAQVNVRSSPAALDVFEGAEDVVEALQQIFDATLPIVARQESPGSWTLQVDVPAGDLFAEGSGELTPEGAETLNLISAVLDDPNLAASRYHLDMLYGVSDGGSGIEGHREALARAGLLVRTLERLGLQPARLSTGLLPSFGGRVRFYFTLQLDAPPAAGRGN